MLGLHRNGRPASGASQWSLWSQPVEPVSSSGDWQEWLPLTTSCCSPLAHTTSSHSAFTAHDSHWPAWLGGSCSCGCCCCCCCCCHDQMWELPLQLVLVCGARQPAGPLLSLLVASECSLSRQWRSSRAVCAQFLLSFLYGSWLLSCVCCSPFAIRLASRVWGRTRSEKEEKENNNNRIHSGQRLASSTSQPLSVSLSISALREGA